MRLPELNEEERKKAMEEGLEQGVPIKSCYLLYRYFKQNRLISDEMSQLKKIEGLQGRLKEGTIIDLMHIMLQKEEQPFAMLNTVRTLLEQERQHTDRGRDGRRTTF